MKKSFTYILILSLACACSTKKPESPSKASPPKTPKIVGSEQQAKTSFDAAQLANEMESFYYTEIRFKKGSSELTSEAKSSILKTMDEAKANKALHNVKLITWADSEMPSDQKKRLSHDQIALAQKRNDTLESFITKHDKKVDVDPISMAERPYGLNKVLPNETARIQKSLDDAGVPETGEKKNGQSKASRSIVIFLKRG